jgi:hypothetical protein
MKVTMIAFGAATLLGLASTVLAIQPLGAKTHRPVIRSNAITAYAQAPAGVARHGALQASRSFTAEEQALFARMGRPE